MAGKEELNSMQSTQRDRDRRGRFRRLGRRHSDLIFRELHPPRPARRWAKSLKNPTSTEFAQIIALVRDKHRMISASTKGTLERRLEHRMNGSDRGSPIISKLLREKPGEAELLARIC